MKFILILLVVPTLFSCRVDSETSSTSAESVLVVVKRDYDRPSLENVTIAVDWEELTGKLPRLKSQGFRLTDQHFGKTLSGRLVNADDDPHPDLLSVDYQFTSAEPQFTFMISADPQTQQPEVQSGDFKADGRFGITIVEDYATFIQHDTITDWPQKIFESSLNFYPDPQQFTIISPGQWTYEHGMFLNAGFELWQRTKNQRYLDYIKSWVDLFLTPEGRIMDEAYDVAQYRLDDILPGRLCLFLYEQTGDARYKTAADQLIDHLEHQPVTSEGGYWHKQVYPHQMWLDGIYMADIFSMQYGEMFNQPEWFDEAARQIQLISMHTRDSVNGLMYHGWDESKNPVWADPVTGASPAFWGRAIGWYFAAVIDCLDYLPEDHPSRQAIVAIFRDLAGSIAKYQDADTKLWYQVIDKGDQPGNWIETSCSAMFTYGFAKGVNKGLLDEAYRKRAREAFDALVRDYTWFDSKGNLYFDQTVKVGTLNLKVSKGDYEYYIGGERRINDYKGLGALLYASLALSFDPSTPSTPSTSSGTTLDKLRDRPSTSSGTALNR